MAAIRRFEDIEAWQTARKLVRSVYEVTVNDRFARDYALRDQIRRAATSAMANIAEGYERNGNKEFMHFLYVAKASSGEVRSHLYVALDLDYISQEQFRTLSAQCREVSRKIYWLIRSLEESQYKGPKYQSDT